MPSSSSSDEEVEEIDKEEQQRRLEQEMIKRRERIERWRAERKRDTKAPAVAPAVVKSAKKWSLEDESEEDDSNHAPPLDSGKKDAEPDSPPSKFHSIRKRFDDDAVEPKFSPMKRPTFSKAFGAKLGMGLSPKTEAELKKESPAAVVEHKEVKKEPKPEPEPVPVKLVEPATAPVKMETEEVPVKKEPQVETKPEPEPEPEPEVAPPPEAEPEDDIDPLDAYMQEVNNEMRRVNNFVNPPTKAQGVVILTGVAKKKSTTVKKGELIEQNMDSLEYSSEDELEDIRDTAVNLAMKHRKELAKIDHSSVSYAPFRKNFYVEVPELGRMTASDVEKYRTELEGVQVKGKGCPKPIKVSSSLHIGT